MASNAGAQGDIREPSLWKLSSIHVALDRDDIPLRGDIMPAIFLLDLSHEKQISMVLQGYQFL
jgi:hypothetical protein